VSELHCTLAAMLIAYINMLITVLWYFVYRMATRAHGTSSEERGWGFSETSQL